LVTSLYKYTRLDNNYSIGVFTSKHVFISQLLGESDLDKTNKLLIAHYFCNIFRKKRALEHPFGYEMSCATL